METTNPVSSFVANNPEMARGRHMRCVGTGLLALWKKSPESALRIGVSIMDASKQCSPSFLGSVSYIGVVSGDATFLRSLSAYEEKPVNDDQLMSAGVADLYSHRTALSRFVEMACSHAAGGLEADEWGECRARDKFCMTEICIAQPSAIQFLADVCPCLLTPPFFCQRWQTALWWPATRRPPEFSTRPWPGAIEVY